MRTGIEWLPEIQLHHHRVPISLLLMVHTRAVMGLQHDDPKHIVLRRYAFRHASEHFCTRLWVVPHTRKVREVSPKDEPPIPVPGPMPQRRRKRRLKRKSVRTRR